MSGASAAHDPALLTRLERRLPPGLRLLSEPAADHTRSLFPIEAACIQRAVASRRHEFSSGRRLARRGLAGLGLPAGAIPRGDSGEPIWPAGVVGSITHSGSSCAVALGFAAQYRGIGLDLELSAAPQPALAGLIVAPSEPADYRSGEMLRLVFSAKEAVFKCVYPLRRTFIDFLEVAISFDHECATFLATAVNDPELARGLAAGSGVFELDDAGAVTLFTLAEPAPT